MHDIVCADLVKIFANPMRQVKEIERMLTQLSNYSIVVQEKFILVVFGHPLFKRDVFA